MPPKRRQTGRGVIGDVASFIRDQKLISKGLGMLPHPAAQAASQIAAMVGLGKKRRAVRRRPVQRGRGIFSDLGGGIGSVFGGLGGGIGGIARGLFGAGQKKKRVTRRVAKYT